MALFNPFSSAFGLDIGDRTFKLVEVRRRLGKGSYKITAWNTIDVPEGVMDRGDIVDMNKAVDSLSRLVHTTRGRVHGQAVVACLPEAKTFIKIIEVPGGSTEQDLKRATLKEIEQNIPLPQDEIYYDWQVFKDTKTAKDAKEAPAAKKPPKAPAAKNEPPQEAAPLPPMPLLIGASPKALVDNYTLLLESAGLAPIALEIEAMAISRAIIPSDVPVNEAVGILDIGATRSSLVIYDSGALQMSISIPISGIAITKLVSDTLGVNLADAELLKRECGLDPERCEDKLWKILLPLIDDMTEKLRNALRFYRIGFPQGKKIERLYLCGGGAQFREIDSVLSRKLTIQARRGNALVNIDKRVPRGFPKKDEALSYATAIGLAMRAADENAKYRNSF